MYGGRLVFLEPSLVEFSLDEVWAILFDFFEYGFLHNLRDVRPHHYRSGVERVSDLKHHSVFQILTLLE